MGFLDKRVRRIALVAAPIVALCIPAAIPTRVGPLVDAYPPIADRSARRPLPPGACSLVEECDAGGARRPVVVTSVREEEVAVPSSIAAKGISALKGTLSIPVGPTGRRPAVVLVGGSGPHDRQCFAAGDVATRTPFELCRALADVFAREGFVVLRTDKRSPRFYPELAARGAAANRDFEFTDFERDVADQVTWLAAREEVDPAAVLAAGHSEGGEIVLHLAASHTVRLAAIVVLSAVIDPFGPESIEALGDARLRQGDLIQFGASRYEAHRWRSCVADLTRDYRPEATCLAGNVDQRTFKQMVDYMAGTAALLPAIDVPTFAIQGSVDRNVSPTTIPRLRDAMKGRDVEVHYVRGANHLLVDVVNPPSGPTAFHPEVVARLRAFVASVARSTP
jgi:alpha-beta hydrolase superfamily lysophospholipase